ncbi:hypothetical protein [Aestuariivivens sediminis]|uniref:hypothetical protein n=1 Tax=Aestuariivivens sediminis TaxID=2913557 RepID=UPI001F579657|nr:hypothetical protein [Aestuariivivens sediminis]
MKYKLSLLLLFILLFQGCKIYDSKSTTKEDALLFSGKVKVKSVSNTSYKFEKLIMEGDSLYGIGKKVKAESKNEFNNNIVNQNPNDKYVKILLTDSLVNEIHLYNKGKTNALKVVGFGTVALYLLAVLTSLIVLTLLVAGG